MACFEGDTDFAVGFEPADAGPVASTRIDNDKGAASEIDANPFGRNNARKGVINRALKRPAIDYQFHCIVQHVRHCFFVMLAILISPLTHRIPEQHLPLSRVDQVSEPGVQGIQARDRFVMIGRHFACPFRAGLIFVVVNANGFDIYQRKSHV